METESWIAMMRRLGRDLISAKTSTGETITIDSGEIWGRNKITTDCPTCPLHIPPDRGMRMLKKFDWTNSDFRNGFGGFCTYYMTMDRLKNTRTRFLYPNSFQPTSSCRYGANKREARMNELRAQKRLVR